MKRISALVCSIVLGCGATSSHTTPDYPGPLHDPASYPQDFSIDQTVTAIHTQGRDSFRAVVEKNGSRLVMIGLAPHGGRGFVLTQEGDEITFESHLPRDLPFPPRYMLLDVHRAWLLGIPGAPLSDGEHRAEIEGEEVVEVWDGGRLRSRTFTRTDHQGAIRIAYEGGLDPDLRAPGPTQVSLENGWFGYRLELTNIVRRPLPIEP